MKYSIILLILLVISNSIFASDSVLNTRTENTLTQNTLIETTHLGVANDWDLNEAEWKQYKILLQGPSGHYYANLSPPEVLGINAQTSEEMRHYAEIAARLEHDKLDRELRFNSAFHEAAARLYSAEPIIKPFDYTPFTPIPKN